MTAPRNFRSASHWSFATVACLLVLTAVGCDGGSEDDTEKELVIVSYGGAYQTAQRRAFFQPFSEAYNVSIREVSYDGDLAQIRQMVESGNVTWDVVDVESPVLLQGADENLYVAINQNLLPKDELMAQAVQPYGVACCFWSTVLAYNTMQFPDTNSAPASWSDFWDIDTFPGGRSLRNSPVGTLEIALMADGVDPDNLYPLDVDRAFTSLDKIKSSITVWWEDGEQPADLIADGLAMASAYNGRIYAARQGGASELEVWNQGLIDADWWVIVKGSQQVDLAQQFIAFASQSAQQVQLPSYIPYGPVNTVAAGMLPASEAASLPTSPAHAAVQVYINSEWWLQNQASVDERWGAWKAQSGD